MEGKEGGREGCGREGDGKGWTHVGLEVAWHLVTNNGCREMYFKTAHFSLLRPRMISGI